MLPWWFVSTLFISFSSTDRGAAVGVKQRLEAQGYEAPFLDFHPEDGIPAGRRWEPELRRRIAMSRAVVLLCTPRSVASRWCFAEVQLAKSLEKPVFPIVLEPCEMFPALAEVQVIDVSVEGEAAWERLWRGLELAELDPDADFAYKPGRPPYPGLDGFTEDDAAVFCGRDREIRDALAMLDRMREAAHASVLVIAGASGAGKSSLLRAGLLPRLRKHPARWSVIGPFRPRDDGLAALDLALNEAESLPAAAKRRTGDALVEAVGALADRVRREAGCQDRVVLIVIDQLDEIFDPASGEMDTELLMVLERALGTSRRRVFVVATIPSRLLDRLQLAPAWNGRPLQVFSLGRLPEAQLPEVVARPAEKAGMVLDGALAARICARVPDSDALPLLSFALRRMYDESDKVRFREQDVAKAEQGLDEYLASVADSLVRATAPKVSDRELAGFFLRFARVAGSTEHTAVVRKPVRREEVPRPMTKLVDAFVANRLFNEGDDRIEVTHEALFRVWKMKGWISTHRRFLDWQGTLADRMSQHASGHGELLAGSALRSAHEFRKTYAATLSKAERDFIAKSILRRRVRLAALAVLVGGMLGVAGFFARSSTRSQSERDRAARQAAVEKLTREAVAKAELASRESERSGDEEIALQHALEAYEQARRAGVESWPAFARSLHDTTIAARTFREWPIQATGVGTVGTSLAIFDTAGVSFYDDLDAPPRRRLELGREYAHIDALGPDGPWITASSYPDSTKLWSYDRGGKLSSKELPDGYLGTLGNKVLLKRSTAPVEIIEYDPMNGQRVPILKLPEVEASSGPFAVDSPRRRIAFVSDGASKIVVYSLDNKRLINWFGLSTSEVVSIDFSPDGSQLAATTDGPVMTWLLEDVPQKPVVEGVEGTHCAFAFSADSTAVAMQSLDGKIKVLKPGGLWTKSSEWNGGKDCSLALSPDGRAVYYATLCHRQGRSPVATARLGSQTYSGFSFSDPVPRRWPTSSCPHRDRSGP